MSMFAAPGILFLGLVSFMGQARAGSFLQHLPVTMDRNMSDPTFQKALFAELEEVLGGELSSDTKQRVDEIEDAVRPMFNALPKNAHKKLDHSAVKYVLRRLFMKRQGWSIGGLEASNEAWDAANGSAVLEDFAPEVVQTLFRKHIHAEGAGLHEVAVLAAMMEHLIFEDMLGKLVQAYKAKRISPEEAVSREEAQSLIALHMASFIRARDVSDWTPGQVERFEKLIYVLYPNWKQTLALMIEVMERVTPNVEYFMFDEVASVAAEVGSLFAHWQNEQCKGTKQLLVDMEHGTSGRVRLVDFYNAALHQGKYQFTETITYLRQIGVLDESDELNPRVIIPNYVTGRSNCVARAGYYSVCCLDECEDTFSHVEETLGKSMATVDEITSALSEEGFSIVLKRRLEEIGNHHDGQVPLHGRLFAQWMHLAFPRDCNYPHKSGTVYYNSMEQWELETGERSGSTMQEIEHWSNHLTKLMESREETSEPTEAHDHLTGMWTMEEELIVHHKKPSKPVNKLNFDMFSKMKFESWIPEVGTFEGGIFIAAVALMCFVRYNPFVTKAAHKHFKDERWCV